MATPIGLRFYNCFNAGIGIIIWPQLRSSLDSSKVLWNAPSGQDKLYINDNVTVDLSTTGLGTADTFYLSEYTMFGEDMWDPSQVFYYDPTCTVTAYAVKHGGVDDGGLVYSGCKAERPGLDLSVTSIPIVPLAAEFQAYGNAVADERIRDLLREMFNGYGPPAAPWKGLVKWISGTNPNLVAVGITVIIASLITKGYHVIYSSVTSPDGSIVTSFFFGPTEVAGPVPQQVIDNWNAAVKKAQQGGSNPINEGVSANSLKA